MGHPKILKASAGSGKTYQLTYAYIRCLMVQAAQYRHILAVTFTNRATEEMKQRILREIHALADGQNGEFRARLEEDLKLSPQTIRHRAAQARTFILHDYSHFNVITIDKFFQRIIRAFLRELSIDIDFNLELQTDSLLEQATDQLIEAIAQQPELRKWVVGFAEEKIEQEGKWDIRSEIMRLGQELFKEQYKQLNLQPVDQQQIESVFSRIQLQCGQIKDALQDMARTALETIARNGRSVEDFAYGREGCVGYFCKIAEGKITPYGKRVSEALTSDEKWFPAKSPLKKQGTALVTSLQPLLRQLCEEVDRTLRFLNTAQLIRTNYRSFALLSDLASQIDAICVSERILPIAETNTIIHRLIAGNDTPFIYEKAGNTFSVFMIDEFQDTSSQQWENFRPLLENAVAQQTDSPVLLVGDIKQSIYRWRGGEWQILGRRVQETFRHVEEQVLETNFRSLGMIVSFNNHLLDACVRTDNARLNDLLENGISNGSIPANLRPEWYDMLLCAYKDLQQKTNRSADAGYVRITEYNPDDKTQVHACLIETLESLQQRGYAAGDIAVLVRTNAQGTDVARLLLDHKAQHPDTPYHYDVVTQEALLISHAAVVGFIIATLRIAADPNDRIQHAVFNNYLGRTPDQPLTPEELSSITHLRLLSPEEAFSEIVLRYRLNESHGEIAYLQALEEEILALSASRITDISLFLQWWKDKGVKRSVSLPLNRDAIHVITIHKAKGLQYKAVILPYCDWNLQPQSGTLLWAQSQTQPFDALGPFPLSWNKSIQDSCFNKEYCTESILSHIDNINLFYVALTRAEEELHLLIPQPSRKQQNRIGNLISESIHLDTDNRPLLGSLTGTLSVLPERRIISFGSPVFPVQENPPHNELQTEFPIEPNKNTLRFSLNVQRYFETPASPAKDNSTLAQTSPRYYGVLMHKVLEQIKDHTQIESQVQRLHADGLLSEQESRHLKSLIERSLENPIVRSWFSPDWESVYNERSILIPHKTHIRRPDRVMIRDNKAVVVDYKFGRLHPEKHTRQIQSYMHLIKKMGYSSVQGYLWYAQDDYIEEILPDNL